MYRRYRLEPLTGAHRPIDFEWDASTGDVRGPDAEEVRRLAMDAKRAGEVVGHPYPTIHRVSDPLRRIEELAIVLGNQWLLAGDLLAAYPDPQIPLPEDDADDPDLYTPPEVH